ncbi:MAG: RNA polymerase sigma factor [Candidatus Binatia bacterium]
MLAAQGGDRASYRELLDDLVPDLRAYLRRTMNDAEDGEDALQDTLLALHRYRHTYSPGRPFEPWLFAIARNVARDHLHKRRQRRDRERHPEILPEQAVDLDEGVERRLHEGIAALSPSQREAMMMVKLDGYSVEEAARQTGTSPGALKLRIHRAYLALKQLLES